MISTMPERYSSTFVWPRGMIAERSGIAVLCSESVDVSRRFVLIWKTSPNIETVSSMALRVLYQTRSYGKSYDVCDRLAMYLSSITSGSTVGVDVPLQFFLVERRQDNRKDQRVYCCRKSDSIHFMQQLRAREGIKVSQSLCENHSECRGDGVCVVKLEPAVDKVDGDEAQHCWDKFRSVVSINAQTRKSVDELKQPIRVLNIQTKTALPDFRQGIEIKKIEIEETDVQSVCNRTVQKAVRVLEQIISDFNTYLEYSSDQFKDSPNTLFGKDLPRFKETLLCVLTNPNCAQDCVLLFKEKNPELAKQYAQQLSVPLFELLRVYRRAVREINNELKDEKEKKIINDLLDECTAMIKTFVSRQNIEMIPDDDVYQGISDPMSEFCPYESEYE